MFTFKLFWRLFLCPQTWMSVSVDNNSASSIQNYPLLWSACHGTKRSMTCVINWVKWKLSWMLTWFTGRDKCKWLWCFFFLFKDYQKVFDADRSSHVAREALMVSDSNWYLSVHCPVSPGGYSTRGSTFQSFCLICDTLVQYSTPWSSYANS